MKKIAIILYIWLIRFYLASSECYDTTYSRCDEFNTFDGYIMSYDAVDAERCQIEFCQSNNDCKAFIYNSAESELQCHIFNKNLNWESCEKVGAYISDNINTCRNEPGHHSPLDCEVNKKILFRRNCKGIIPKRKKKYFFSDICRRRLHI